ncbi:MAG: nitrous oxide reductase family maturation protein NosD [Promethearchaeota archaeon]
MLKSNKIRKFKFYVLIASTIFMVFSGYTFMDERVYNNFARKLRISGFWVLNPFIIDDNGFGNYTWAEAALEPWCDGSGTWNDPYIIENITIDAGFSGDCIGIENSNVFFIIRNCTLINAGYLNTGGIYLYRVNNGALIDNIISFNYFIGIALFQSNNITIQENTGNFNGYWGIFLNDSHNNILIGNTFNNNYEGIYLLYCSNNTIIDNTANSNEDDGIDIDYCCYTNISKNTMNGNGDTEYHRGLEMNYCNFSYISENILNYNGEIGIMLHYCDYNNVLNNTVEYNGVHGILVQHGDNHNISNNIAKNNGDIGIFSSNCHYVNVLNNSAKNNGRYGILVQHGDNNIIYNNIAENNGGTGLYIYNCNENSVINNTINFNLSGISLGSCTNNTLSVNREISNVNYGISFSECENIEILSNIIENSGYNGITLRDCNSSNISFNYLNKSGNNGINIWDSNISNVSSNYIHNSGINGIYIQDSNFNNLSSNYINNSGNNGIETFRCDNNTIIQNIMIDNNSTGIYVFSGKHHEISENLVNYNKENGIYLHRCNYINVKKNIADFNGHSGIIASDGDFFNISYNTATSNEDYGTDIYETRYSNVLKNKLDFNKFGLRLWSCNESSFLENSLCGNNYSGLVSYFCYFNKISRNTANYNGGDGIDFNSGNYNNVTDNSVSYNGETGIDMYQSYYNEIAGNNIFRNNDSGIWLYGCNDNIISENKIINNKVYGVWLSYTSFDNLFYSNYFICNTRHVIDYNTNNYWNNTNIGNFWDNYTGEDISPVDGIGDTPHVMSSGIDYLPIIDLNIPVIEVISPFSTSVFSHNAPDFTVWVSGNNLDSRWYTFGNGKTIYTFPGLTGTINQSAWDQLGDGSVTIMFYINNTAGNITCTSSIELIKDTVAPTVTIISPSPNQFCGISSPSFNVQVLDNYLLEKSYSINGRPNITFTWETQFNQSEWDNIGNGTVSITFYGIDKAGNLDSSQIVVRKDAIVPQIYLNSPFQNEEFAGIAPHFNLTIIEDHLTSTWYKIEGITGNFFFTGLNGTIDQTAWDLLLEGSVTLTFYAEDAGGNFNSYSVEVIKRIPSQSLTFPWQMVIIIIAVIAGVATALIYYSIRRKARVEP